MSNSKELTKYLDNKFAYIDRKFKNVGTSFTKIDEKFVEIIWKINDIDERFEEVIGKLGILNENFQTLQTSVDNYSKEAKDNRQEIRVLNHRVDKLEKSPNAL